MSEFKFSCPACGQNILTDTDHAGTDITCPACHALIVVPKETTGAAEAPAPGATPPAWTGYNATPAAPQTSRLAIASLVCSLASLVTCVGWLPGIICGHLARSRIRRNPALKGNGLATAGLTIGYLILMLEAGVAAVRISSFATAVKHGYENARHQLATNTVIVTQVQTTTATNASQPAEPVAATWIADLSQVTFPDQPAGGKLHGNDFTLKTAMFRAANLKLNSENGLSLEVLGLGAAIEGRSFDISTTDEGAGPRVRMTWNDDAAVQTATFSKGYAMKLQFGQAVNRKMSGKIYVCLPDDAKSYVAGTFDVHVPKAK
jgi:hypothetical protein